ncbi:MAG TPA: hypothetical protein VLA16_11785, partial [Ideonella sp.]|nr:hypothetical protein [Ideonella sp.]
NDGAPLPGAAEAKARWRDAPPRPVPQEVLAAPTPPWAAGLLASLRREAARPQAQAALRRAMEAWRCGRAVLLACPQAGPDPASGWLFVLEPGDDAQQPCLQGQRFAARLSWRAPGEQGRWWAVRVAKVHSVRQGRQLNTLAAAGSGSAAAVDCEIQLGPFPLLQPHWREVLVRVDAVQRLWAALDVAWSLPLLVCDRPLLAGGAGPVGERAS